MQAKFNESHNKYILRSQKEKKNYESQYFAYADDVWLRSELNQVSSNSDVVDNEMWLKLWCWRL